MLSFSFYCQLVIESIEKSLLHNRNYSHVPTCQTFFQSCVFLSGKTSRVLFASLFFTCTRSRISLTTSWQSLVACSLFSERRCSRMGKGRGKGARGLSSCVTSSVVTRHSDTDRQLRREGASWPVSIPADCRFRPLRLSLAQNNDVDTRNLRLSLLRAHPLSANPFLETIALATARYVAKIQTRRPVYEIAVVNGWKTAVRSGKTLWSG